MIKIIGAIFCQVVIIIILIQFIPSITLGYHKWNGAIPIFIMIAQLKINIGILSNCSKEFFVIKEYKKTNKINIEAVTWTRKYFSEVSVDCLVFSILIRGTKANKFISSPIQMLIQENEEIEIKVPVTIIIKNINFIHLIIKKRGIPI